MGCNRLKTLMLTVCVGWGLAAHAQLEGRVLQSMLDQLAALNAYAAAADEGYKIVEGGLHNIATIRQGEWDLHQTHYASLLTVGAGVRGMPEAADIVNRAGLLANAGRRQEASAAVSDLTALLTDGQLSMTDGERMRRIIALDARLRKREQ